MNEEDVVLEKPTADNITEPVTEPEDVTEPATEDAEEKEPVAEEVKKEDDQPKKNHDQRRWERLLNERAEFKAKVELYERQQQAQQTQTPDSGRPARENFGSDEDYVDALTDWKLEQKWAPMQQKMAEQQRAQQLDVEWDSKLARAKTEYSDFDDVLSDAQDIPITQVMAQTIKSSDVGADLAYFLGKDPDYAVKISRMDPLSAARELGRIESYIEYDKSSKKSAAKPAVSKAPNPIKPMRSSTSSSTKSLEDMTPAEYMAYRNKQVAERSKRR